MTNELFLITFAIHIYTVIFMSGVIWIIQLVHYPMFADLDARTFEKSMINHQKGMSKVVLMTMLIELFTGSALIYLSKDQIIYFTINFIALLIIWFVTFTISVPCHSRLLVTKNSDVINRLVKTNWTRTFLWSARSLAALYFIFNNMMVKL